MSPVKRQRSPSSIKAYAGQEPAQAAQEAGIELQVIKLAEAKKGFVLLPCRWMVERSFGWITPVDATDPLTFASQPGKLRCTMQIRAPS